MPDRAKSRFESVQSARVLNGGSASSFCEYLSKLHLSVFVKNLIIICQLLTCEPLLPTAWMGTLEPPQSTRPQVATTITRPENRCCSDLGWSWRAKSRFVSVRLVAISSFCEEKCDVGGSIGKELNVGQTMEGVEMGRAERPRVGDRKRLKMSG
jgi:hypothetical protein